jgi:hypothetical protein
MSLRDRIEEIYADHEPPLLFMDGFDDCIAGVAHRFNDTFVVYDLAKVIARLMADGMTEEEAHDFWSYNQLGGWHGESTPGFLSTPQEEDEDGVQPDERG